MPQATKEPRRAALKLIESIPWRPLSLAGVAKRRQQGKVSQEPRGLVDSIGDILPATAVIEDARLTPIIKI